MIVAGLGAMGGAAAYHLAKRGKTVLGLDRFRPPHDRGSSHGESRIIREAYWEHPGYVPLVQRAYGLWAEAEKAARTTLYRQTGAVLMGVPDGTMIPGARRALNDHGIAHEDLSVSEVRKRFPALRPKAGLEALFETRAGILDPERCVQAHLDLAAKHGATLRFGEALLSWTSAHDGVEVRTDRRTYRAEKLVLAAGPWMAELLTDAGVPLQVERQVISWWRPKAHPERFALGRLPIYLFENAQDQFWYGFPDLGTGVKAARHHQGKIVDPDKPIEAGTAAEIAGLRPLFRTSMPDLDGDVLRVTTCLYTNTPDAHFILDTHPEDPNVVVASPCSGHGFKFAPVVGEIAADLAIDGQTDHDTRLFGLRRFRARSAGP